MPVSGGDKGSPVERVSALVLRSALPKNPQARSTHRFRSVLAIQKVLAVQRRHPLPRGFIFNLPQAHNYCFCPGHLERPPEPENSLCASQKFRSV